MKTVSENASFQKHSPDGDFWKCCLSCGRTKTEFSNTISWCHTSCSACPVRLAIVFPFFVASACGGQKRLECATWRRIFSTMDKKISFFKNNRIRVGLWTADVFPVVAFLRERSDDRKYVCSSQAKYVWTRPESVKKTNTRKSLQFLRKKSGYLGKKRMDGSLNNVWIALRD